jgi:hypothetical protein
LDVAGLSPGFCVVLPGFTRIFYLSPRIIIKNIPRQVFWEEDGGE